VHEPSMPEAMSSADLVKELTSNASLLLQRQIRLATLEARRELTRGLTMAELLGSGGLILAVGLVLLIVATVIGIGVALGGCYWASALVVAAPFLIGGGLLGGLGWHQRVKQPLPHTRTELQKEVSWAKYRTT
jgi:hypothetical protein